MPYRELLPCNVYDAFRPRELSGLPAKVDGYIRLLGNRNVGTTHLTNLKCAGMPVAHDQTFFIRKWYARTNVTSDDPAFLRAWSAFTHATTVTMVMGCAPIAQLTLVDLLAPPGLGLTCVHRGDPCGDPNCGDNASLDLLAAHLAAAHLNAAINLRDGLHSSEDRCFVGMREWEFFDDKKRERWRSVARVARSMMCGPSPIILPPRQCIAVTVETDPRALGSLLEIMPTNIAPECLMWVHLDGVAAR